MNEKRIVELQQAMHKAQQAYGAAKDRADKTRLDAEFAETQRIECLTALVVARHEYQKETGVTL